MDNHNSPTRYNRPDELQAARRAGRTHWWSRLPGISSSRVPDKLATQPDIPTLALPSGRPPQAPATQLPTITIDSSDVSFAYSSKLPEAAGVIDPSLLHAPFLREPLFVPSPGSGQKVLRQWFPRDHGVEHGTPAALSHSARIAPRRLEIPIKSWLHYAEPEFYHTISPGQPLRLCKGDGPGLIYQVRGCVGPVEQGLAFWAEPEEDSSLPWAVVLFLPPGTRCPPGTPALLQELAYEAILFGAFDHSPSLV